MGWGGEWVPTNMGLHGIKQALKEGLEKWGSGYELLYMSFKLGVVYAAMKAPDGEVFAAIQLWQYNSKSGELMTKTMTDASGPYKCEAPKKLLKLLSPTNEKYAIDWRKRAWSKFKNIPKEYML